MHQGISVSKPERVLILDGLRFLAAFSVLLAHYAIWVFSSRGIHNSMTDFIATLSGLGMPLFFVLSGFVIHYNYNQVRSKPGGVKTFLIARFTRLYPLYIILFITEFSLTFARSKGSCGHAGERLGLFLALPYHLTLTQDWVFGIIGQNSLIYQYGMCSAVTWSISLEVFFYLSYLLFAGWLNNRKSSLQQLLLIIIAQTATVIFLFLCERFIVQIEHISLIGFGHEATLDKGYQDSFLRWLLYFCPYVNLPAFLIGTLLANIYMNIKTKPLTKIENLFAGWITLCSFLLLLAAHFWLYGILAPKNGSIGRTSSILIIPLVALFIFCCVRYSRTLPCRALSCSLFVKLGEASYSIYLLHAFLWTFLNRKLHFAQNYPWLLYILAMVSLLIISRLSYLLLERPLQYLLRKKLSKQPSIPAPLTLFQTQPL